MDYDELESINRKISFSNLGKPALAGLAALLIMVAVLASRLILGTAAASEFAIEAAHGLGKASSSSAVSTEEAGGEEGLAENVPKVVYVHVSGAVNEPGLCEVAEGSRLAAAIEAAGGFAEDAQVDSVNLARHVQDGEHVVVASEHDAQQPLATSGEEAQEAAPAQTGLVNLNVASSVQLQELPGIGPALAERIVAYREANGPFASVDELANVSGIGEKKLSGLIDFVTV